MGRSTATSTSTRRTRSTSKTARRTSTASSIRSSCRSVVWSRRRSTPACSARARSTSRRVATWSSRSAGYRRSGHVRRSVLRVRRDVQRRRRRHDHLRAAARRPAAPSRSAPIRRCSPTSPISTARWSREITPAGGLFRTTMFYDNVIDANTRNGGFDGAQCVHRRRSLRDRCCSSLDCIEDADDNIDLAFERTPFDEIPGLTTTTARRSAEGLECIYDPSLTGGIADLLARSVPDHRSGRLTTSRSISCPARATPTTCSRSRRSASTITTCSPRRPTARSRHWPVRCSSAALRLRSTSGVRSTIRSARSTATSRPVDYRSKRMTGIVGIDANVGGNAIIGASIGKVTNHLRRQPVRRQHRRRRLPGRCSTASTIRARST